MAEAPSLTVGPAPSAHKSLNVFLVGNPNTGKTTLFNALTGLRHRVGNYAGVTVETKTGQAKLPEGTLHITDVPGTYSLSPRSPDEMLTVDLLLGHRAEAARPDVVVCILDASNLERNLYLATQVLELGVPTVFALNMIDVADSQGIVLDVPKLTSSLGVPVVPVQANIKRGMSDLTRHILAAAESKMPPSQKPVFPDAFIQEVDALGAWLKSHAPTVERNGQVERYLLERALIDAGGHTEKTLARSRGPELLSQLEQARQRLREAGHSVPAVEARTRYGWIAERLAGSVRRPATRRVTLSDRIDAVLMHRFWGLVIFLAVMAIVFQSIFAWAGFLMDPIGEGFGALGEAVGAYLPEGALRELVSSGIIAGVGNVLIFLPQIVILFGFIAILEDCGYMARAAFLMDKIMAPCGLSGKSFIPLMSSFACAIPGVMAARTIEDRRDRFATILVAPLMSCSARIPVYILLIGTFIPGGKVLGFLSIHGLVLLAMYLIGLVVAPLVALLLKSTVLRGDTPVFLMELPSYKFPSIAMVLHRMTDRGWAFVKRAGTLILATTVIIWALQYYPRPASIAEAYAPQQAELEAKLEPIAGEREAVTEELAKLGAQPLEPDDEQARAALSPEQAVVQQKQDELNTQAEAIEEEIRTIENRIASEYQAQSYLGRMGHAIEPIVRPLGWDWRIGMAAIASFPAREVVVSALGTIYSVGEDTSEEDPKLQDALRAATWPDGSPVFTIPVAVSLMVFFALCAQCAATLAVIKRETNSWRWPIFTFVYMTGLAYVAAFAVYQIGSRMG